MLEIAGFRTPAHAEHALDLVLRAGEILGMAGLVGAGRTELARAIFGIDRPLGGALRLDGRRLAIASPRDAIDHGIFLVPEDRKRSGLVLDFSVTENVSLANLQAFAMGLIVRSGAGAPQRRRAPRRARHPHGLGRHAGRHPVGRQPAEGGPGQVAVDDAAGRDLRRADARHRCRRQESEIYKLMRGLADAGVAVLMISSDMEEVVGVSDRIVVMREGRIAGFLERADFSEENVMRLAVGRRDLQAAEAVSMLKKDLGLLVLILVVGLVVSILNPRFLSPINLGNTANLIGLFGLFSIGAGIVIITGGIDLSVGSMFALLGVVYVDLLVGWQVSWWLATIVVVAGRRRAGRDPRLPHHPAPPATLHRHPVRPADLSRHRPLLHQRRHRGLRVRPVLPDARMADGGADAGRAAFLHHVPGGGGA